ncbi:PQQ-binding-like beta-propeller repeat protein [Methylocystis sp.]|uniref:outer membrane protein assembly factor BamB family protein n=1 Tax=Methylocystis sp. TaxID=1911079 RepID=UPI003DA210A3
MHVRTDIWNQFGGNPAGSGFRAVQTSERMQIDWQSPLPASPGTSSPVIGPDGTIYVGTLNGRLLAIDPEGGNLKWNVEIAEYHYMVQTPAVADDGTVYCLCTSTALAHDHRTPRVKGMPSFVISVGSNGVIRWRVPIETLPDLFGTVNCSLFGAPRILSGPQGSARVIFALRYELVVSYEEVSGDPESRGPLFVRVLAIVDESGRFLLFEPFEELKLFVDAHGGGGFDTTAHLGDPPFKEPEPCADTPVVFGSFPAREPWAIIAAGEKGLYQITWDAHESVLVGAFKHFPLAQPFPAPVAFPNRLLVGLTRSDVTFIDSDTFSKLLPKATKLGGIATVAGGLRQMYFLFRYGALFVVDSNGAVPVKNFALEGNSVAFPTLSANHVHIVTTQGFTKFSLDLHWSASNNLLFDAPHAGLSSPAIGPSGEVYVVGGPNFAVAPSLFRFTSER